MKSPIALTILILAAGSFWGVHETRMVTVLREKHRTIVQQAAALGLSTDASKSATVTKVTKRPREDSERKVKEFANTLVAFAKEMEAMEKSGTQPDANMQKRIIEFVDGMLSLNGDELKILIAEMRNRSDMSDEMRKNMIGFSIMMLAQNHPETALAIFTESSDLMKDNPMSGHVLSSALAQWAKDQPLAALEWIKKNAEKHPELITDQTKSAVIGGAAQSDFGLAFQLIDELKLKENREQVISEICRAADTPERQSELLALLRKNAGTANDKTAAKDMLDTGLRGLFSIASKDGFEQTMKWIETADLSAADLEKCTGDIDYNLVRADAGKWLDWLSSEQASAKDSVDATSNLVRSWTQNDYKAAGEWLATTPAGPLKETATLSYLETVAPYDPEVAAQWAGTLSEAKRVDALKGIHRKLIQTDKTAAEAFAKSHGIEPE